MSRRRFVSSALVLLILGSHPNGAQDSGASKPNRAVIEAAARGEPYALHILGLSIEADDPRYAAELFGRASRLGYQPSNLRLARLMQSGALGTPDRASALDLLKKAAGTGFVDAQVALSAAYFSGAAGEVNAMLGRRWLIIAAQAGHQESQFDLGVLLMKGQGGEQNEFAARRWFKKAADGPPGLVASRAADLVRSLDQSLLDSSASIPEGLLKFLGAALLATAVASALLPDDVGSAPGRSAETDSYLQKLQKRRDNEFACTVQVGGYSERTAAAYNRCCALRGGC